MSAVGRIEISASALRHNLNALRSLVRPGCKVAAVVKANAYGHGLEHVVSILEPQVDAFQVDDLDELRVLRQVTDKRALVFGYVPAPEVEEAVSLGGELSLFDPDQVPAMAGSHAKAHLKIDALLGRLGVLPSGLGQMLDAIADHPGVDILSAYAHYGNIEDTTDPEHALRQEEVFEAAFQDIRERLPAIGRHFSATSGVMARETPDSPNDLIRLGIGLYGLYPSSPLAASHAELGLRPVLRWVSELAQVKKIPQGHPVGYGLSYVAKRETLVGIVPQGYADGFDRGLSNCGAVLANGMRCPVVGRVAMNMFAVDLSATPNARQGDEVVLLGRQGEEAICAEEVADRLDTINYEVVARLSPLLSRRVVD